VNDIADYDAVVLGSAVYTGHWLKLAIEFARRFSDALIARPVWLFSSGPVGDPARKLVQKMAADPVDLQTLRQLTHASDHKMFAGNSTSTH
jgi:menaquinone-dependent protoporphyrinogen oxidase